MTAASPNRALHKAAVAALLALIVLCVAWELFLAPLRPGGSWLVLKVLPLLAVIRKLTLTIPHCMAFLKCWRWSIQNLMQFLSILKGSASSACHA